MNLYHIDNLVGDGNADTDILVKRQEVASTPQQALWQAFGVWVQNSTSTQTHLHSANLPHSTDRHYDGVIGGTLTAKGRFPGNRKFVLSWKVTRVEVDRSQADEAIGDIEWTSEMVGREGAQVRTWTPRS